MQARGAFAVQACTMPLCVRMGLELADGFGKRGQHFPSHLQAMREDTWLWKARSRCWPTAWSITAAHSAGKCGGAVKPSSCSTRSEPRPATHN